ncbi:MAG: winged helix-turn-helix transcriptional regulator [Candidatus Bathyarchaeia archaeon]
MNQKNALTILLVALVLSVAFIAVASASNMPQSFDLQQSTDKLERLTVSVPLATAAGLHSNSSQVLNQPTRLEIYNYIKDNPGVHFRGICENLDLSVGVVQYHLYVLEQNGYITSVVDGQNKRYFQENSYTQQEMALISLTRHQTTAQILNILSQKSSMLHRDIAASLGVSSQALTWQMNQLKKAGLINAEKESVNVKYTLNDVNSVKFALFLTGNSKN